MFESLGQAAPVASEPVAPTVYIASSSDELARFVHLLRNEHRQNLTGVDFSSHVVVAVFGGAIGSGGQQLTVQDVSLVKDQMRIVIVQRAPAPDEYAAAAFTSPYHILQIARSQLPGAVPSAWVMIDRSGRILATSGSGAS